MTWWYNQYNPDATELLFIYIHIYHDMVTHFGSLLLDRLAHWMAIWFVADQLDRTTCLLHRQGGVDYGDLVSWAPTISWAPRLDRRTFWWEKVWKNMDGVVYQNDLTKIRNRMKHWYDISMTRCEISQQSQQPFLDSIWFLPLQVLEIGSDLILEIGESLRTVFSLNDTWKSCEPIMYIYIYI